ncbi:Crotonase-like protein [Cordyceps javanica]|uniref:Crotonase-like protein n=1 Tax=Cordyceps javanica TaxID=43265 RepID=A0A545VKB1_9HYPO|nr:Crotonase-like protein [Cordyceps javanica]TQW02172.1 Crotonase-like protein [Cordyceps javanica]
MASPLREGRRVYDHFYIDFPAEHILQVTINRPEKLNCIDKSTSRQMQDVWELFDNDDSLWVGIITGLGRAFCTGADLGEWNRMNEAGIFNDMGAPGLGGLCRRRGRKPIIAAVNGICMGGGFEMVANCDLVLASELATFTLPEVRRGIAPVAGCLPRLARVIGLQRTMDLALTGRTVNAAALQSWGLVSEVVEEENRGGSALVVPVGGSNQKQGQGQGQGQSQGRSQVVQAAIRTGEAMCRNSPDALIVARRGVRMAWEDGSVEAATEALAQEWYPRLAAGENFAEGLKAFVEKRSPKWTNPKL